MKDILIKGIILIAIIVVIVLLHNYSKRARGTINTEKFKEKFLMGAPLDNGGAPGNGGGGDKGVAAAEGCCNEQNKRVDNLYNSPFPRDCYPRDKLSPAELMPSGDAINSEFAQMNPLGQGDVMNRSFLDAGFHIGINTQGSSMRNPNLSVRSEPPNPRVVVSPWGQSTIEPSDVFGRKPFEIGGSCGEL